MVTQPTGVTVVDPTATGLTLTWTQPAVAPAGYQVQYRKRGTTTWKTVPPVTKQTISGLPANTTLEMRVSSVGTFGQLATTPIMLVTTQAAAPAVGVKAFRIADFLEGESDNAFDSMDPLTNRWGSFPANYSIPSVIAAIKYLIGDSGLTRRLRLYHYPDRDWQVDWCTQLHAATGVKIAIAIGAYGREDTARSLVALAKIGAAKGWLDMVEGCNEPNNFIPELTAEEKAAGKTPVDIVIACQKILFEGLRGSGVTVAGPSIVFGLPYPWGYIIRHIDATGKEVGYITPAERDQLVAYSDVCNAHIYPPWHPDMDDGSGKGTMQDVSDGMALTYPGQRVVVSEWNPTLFNMVEVPGPVDAKGAATSTYARRRDPLFDAYYAPCCMLSGFARGFQARAWFAMFDYVADGYVCGLFPKEGAVGPRPVAAVIAAMYQLTGDKGATKRTFTTGSLAYTVTGLPQNGQTMLFQNSAGTFFLFAWIVRDTPGGASVPVVVNLPAGMTVTDYKVSDPVAPRRALQTTSTGKVTLMLDASVHVLVIR